jgi:phosphate transport system substrate-binding protein
MTILLTALAGQGVAAAPPASPTTLVVAGSGSNLGITRILAEAFSKEHPQITVEVPGSIGTRGAIKAVIEGAIPLGLISRPLKEEEKAKGLVARPYGRTAIVIGVHPSVKDQTISPQELVAIIKGEKKQWQDGNQIIVQAREPQDSGYQVLEDTVPGFKEAYAESHAAKRWTIYFTNQEANNALETVPSAIGLSDLGMMATEGLKIKALKYNGVPPSVETLADSSYPFGREQSIIYRPDNLGPEAKAFLEFVGSSAGSALMQKYGFIPVRSDAP